MFPELKTVVWQRSGLNASRLNASKLNAGRWRKGMFNFKNLDGIRAVEGTVRDDEKADLRVEILVVANNDGWGSGG
jgi:hypothetical protein